MYNDNSYPVSTSCSLKTLVTKGIFIYSFRDNQIRQRIRKSIRFPKNTRSSAALSRF